MYVLTQLARKYFLMDLAVINTILKLESKANNPVSGEQPSKLKGRTDYSSLPIIWFRRKPFFLMVNSLWTCCFSKPSIFSLSLHIITFRALHNIRLAPTDPDFMTDVVMIAVL